MQIRVDGGGVLDGAARLVVRSEQVGGMSGPARRLAAGLRDRRVADGLGTVGDVVADAAELVAQDLGLLAARARAGVARYGQVEDAASGGASR